MNNAEKLAKFILDIQQQVRRIGEGFEEPDDDWISVAFLHSEDGVSVIGLHGEMFASDLSKDALAFWLKLAMTQFKAERYAVLFNTFGLENPSDEDWEEHRNGKRLSEFDNAVEQLLLVTGDSEQEIGYFARIERDGTNPPTLGAWEAVPQLEGRFAKLNERMAALS